MADQLSPTTSRPDLATHNHSENTRPHLSGSERPRKSEAAIPEKWVPCPLQLHTSHGFHEALPKATLMISTKETLLHFTEPCYKGGLL